MGDWSNLPRDVLGEISERLDNGIQYVRFRSVCSSWRSSAPKKPQFPWLAVLYKDDINKKMAFGFYDFPNPHFITPQLAPIEGLVICGSSRGWICLLDGAPSISLHNPFTGVQIQLPPLTHFPKSSVCPSISKLDDGGFLVDGKKRRFDELGTCFAQKLILSSDPISSPNHCVIMGSMYSGKRFNFLLPGSDQWITSRRLPKGINFFEDTVFYKGSFYAVSHLRLFVCDHRDNAKITEIPSAGPSFNDGRGPQCYEKITQSHLVESAGELLLVTTTESWQMGSPITYACEVYQADLSGGLLNLVKLANIGGRSLFLNDNSMSISSGTFPGCKGNQIYLIQFSTEFEDHPDGTFNVSVGKHIAVFGIEDGSSRIITTLSDDTHGIWRTAHWLTPSLCN